VFRVFFRPTNTAALSGVKRPRHHAAPQPSALELFVFTECEWNAFRRRAAAQLHDALWLANDCVPEARRGDHVGDDDNDNDVDDKLADRGEPAARASDGDGDSTRRRRARFAAHASLMQWRHDEHRVYRSVLGERLQLFACGAARRANLFAVLS